MSVEKYSAITCIEHLVSLGYNRIKPKSIGNNKWVYGNAAGNIIPHPECIDKIKEIHPKKFKFIRNYGRNS